MQTAQWQAVYLHGKGGNAREAGVTGPCFRVGA